jgi:hypothetical protein
METTDKPKWQPSREDAEIIEGLKRHQAELGLSDEKFARENLTCSGTVWTRIVSGEYWGMISSGARIITERLQDLDRLERTRAFRAKFENSKFIATTEAKAVFASIEDCLAKPLSSPDRMTVYLAPTRGGKTWLTAEVVRRFRAVPVQAREAWRRSYFTCLRDIAQACGVVASKGYFTTADMERRLVDWCNARRVVLAIDEGEFFSAEALNLIKFLLNSSTVTILLSAIGTAYDAWQRRYPHEGAQILARTNAVIALEPITATAALRWFASVKLEQPAECGEIAAVFANDFGHFAMLQAIASRFDPGERVTPSDIRAAGNDRRVKWRLPMLSFSRPSK